LRGYKINFKLSLQDKTCLATTYYKE